MIKRLLVTLTLLLPAPVHAEPPKTFDEILEAIDASLSTGNNRAAFAILSDALRSARLDGRLTKDFAIFYAMHADFIRLETGNPAYALQLAEDGLALIGGDPAQADFSMTLEISRAYALADLGRLDEAVTAARLALPRMRTYYGDADADDLARRIEGWAKGDLSDFNTSATELARETLDRAYEAMSSNAPGRAITLAANALLPLDTGLPEGEVRSRNAEADLIIARALGRLGRSADSANGYLRALSHLIKSPWQPGTPIDWWPASISEEDRSLLFTLLTELANVANRLGYRDIAVAALTEAEEMLTDPQQQITLMLNLASIEMSAGNVDGALGLIARSKTQAVASDAPDIAAMADFYTAIVNARVARNEDQPVDPAPLIKAVEAALTLADENGIIERYFVLYDAVDLLNLTPRQQIALQYGRELMADSRAQLRQLQDTSFASDQARRAARGSIERYLKAAQNAAGALDPGRSVFCPPNPGYQSCVVSLRPQQAGNAGD